MSESLVNTKRRINTIRSTEKITKAMKLVASVKYQRWRKVYDANKEYYQAMEMTLSRALSSFAVAEDDNIDVKLPEAMKDHPEAKKKLYVILSSSLGLCGAYNYNLFKLADSRIQPEDDLILIGEKAKGHYQNFPNHLNLDYSTLGDNPTYSAVRRLRHYLVRCYKKGEYKEVVLLYTHYKNSLTFVPTEQVILPLSAENNSIALDKNVGYPPIYEPSLQEVIDTIVPHFIDASMYRKFVESLVSEQASRRNAMETATDAADKISAQLKLEYNKARQNAITQEITEVVAGANAGKQKDEEE